MVPESTTDALLGRELQGRYRVDRLIAMGGMGCLYRGVQLSLNRPVAIKVLKPRLMSDPRDAARFTRESRLLASLNHPHIVRLLDVGETREGTRFMVMELLEGQGLNVLVANHGRLGAPLIRDIMLQVAGGLVAAHEVGTVHRDLKPANVFLSRVHGRSYHVKILDFGIARPTLLEDVQVGLTSSQGLVGTPHYMAPEQICGQPVGPWTDIYAFGCVLWELVEGRRVFDGLTDVDVLIAHLDEAPSSPAASGDVLLQGLGNLAMACLEKLPRGRPESAEMLVSQLLSLAG